MEKRRVPLFYFTIKRSGNQKIYTFSNTVFTSDDI